MNQYQLEFLTWLRDYDPAAYEIVAIRAGANLNGWEWLGTAWNAVKTAAKEVAPAVKEAAINVAKAKAQKKLAKKYGVKIDKSQPMGPQVTGAVKQRINKAADRAINTTVKPAIVQRTNQNQQIINQQLWRANNNMRPQYTPKYRPTIPVKYRHSPPVKKEVAKAAESFQITPAIAIGAAGVVIGALRLAS